LCMFRCKSLIIFGEFRNCRFKFSERSRHSSWCHYYGIY
jgi:hypothetical protein